MPLDPLLRRVLEGDLGGRSHEDLLKYALDLADLFPEQAVALAQGWELPSISAPEQEAPVVDRGKRKAAATPDIIEADPAKEPSAAVDRRARKARTSQSKSQVTSKPLGERPVPEPALSLHERIHLVAKAGLTPAATARMKTLVQLAEDFDWGRSTMAQFCSRVLEVQEQWLEPGFLFTVKAALQGWLGHYQRTRPVDVANWSTMLASNDWVAPGRPKRGGAQASPLQPSKRQAQAFDAQLSLQDRLLAMRHDIDQPRAVERWTSVLTFSETFDWTRKDWYQLVEEFMARQGTVFIGDVSRHGFKDEGVLRRWIRHYWERRPERVRRWGGRLSVPEASSGTRSPTPSFISGIDTSPAPSPASASATSLPTWDTETIWLPVSRRANLATIQQSYAVKIADIVVRTGLISRSTASSSRHPAPVLDASSIMTAIASLANVGQHIAAAEPQGLRHALFASPIFGRLQHHLVELAETLGNRPMREVGPLRQDAQYSQVAVVLTGIIAVANGHHLVEQLERAKELLEGLGFS